MTAPQALRVLLVEDSPTDARLVERALRDAGLSPELTRVQDAGALRAALERETWDIVVSDWSLPRFGALAALAVVKELGLDLPFLIVSGTVDEAAAVDAMRAGAHDYVFKDRLARLAPAVERELREARVRAEARRAEAAARASEARFRRLAESGIIGICVTDLHGHVRDANDAYLAMAGYTRAELEAGTVRWDALTPPEWRARTAEAALRLETEGVSPPWEKEMLRRDGTRIPILVGAAMLEPPECIAFYLDLSAAKRTEEALGRSEERLRQAQKMEAIGLLAGGVAHDFNNLLSVILSYSAMLREDLPEDDPMRADLGEIHAAGARAGELTQQLLAFSRKQVLQPRLLRLDEVLARVERLLRRLIGEDVELVMHPGGGPPALLDPGQIEQVVMNLAVNARDAMPRGGKLTVETAGVRLDEGAAAELGAAPGPYAVLSVTDTGTGMDTATVNRIFEPFFTTKEPGRGTGLGLAMVFGLVSQSGGHIAVSSEPGTGTTFRLLFPAAEANGHDPVPDDPPEAASLYGDETVLLVEDDERVRNLARTILRRYGYRVLEASGGGDALLICEQHVGAIHLLMTDVVMPRMSGPQLVERLRPLRPAMRTLYVSGYTDAAVVHHGLVDTDAAFLQKPLTPLAVATKVRQVLDAAARPHA